MGLSGGAGVGTATAVEISHIHLCCSSCVECKAFQSGPLEKNCSAACKNIQYVEELQARSWQCKEKDSNNCWMSFRMSQDDGEEMYTVTVDPKKGTPAPLLAPQPYQLSWGQQMNCLCLLYRVPGASQHRADCRWDHRRCGSHRPGAPADLAVPDRAV